MRRRSAARIGLWAAAGALAAWAGLVLVDAAVDFGPAWRPWIYAAAVLGGAAATGAAAATAWMRRPSVLYVARLVEDRRPELRTSLITFLELAADPDACDAVAARASRLLAQARAEHLAPAAPLRRPLIGGACAAAMLGAALWMGQGVVFRPWVRGAEGGFASRDAPSPAGAMGSRGPAEGQLPRSDDETGTPCGPVPGPRDDGAVEPASAGGTDRADDRRGQESQAGAGGLEGSAAPALAPELARDLARDRERLERLAAAMAGPPNRGAGGERQNAGSLSEHGRRRNASIGARDRSGQPVSPPSLQGEGRANADRAAEPPNVAPSGAGDRGVTDGARGATDGHVPGTGGGGATGIAGGPAVDPLPERPQPAEFPRDALDATRWAERLIRKADERLADGEAGDGSLREMGMGPAELRRFVTSWKRRFDAAGVGGPTMSPPAGPGRRIRDTEPGEVLHTAGDAAARPLVDRPSHGPDGAPAIQEDVSRVAPHLRPYVEAYFEALGRAAAETPTASGEP